MKENQKELVEANNELKTQIKSYEQNSQGSMLIHTIINCIITGFVLITIIGLIFLLLKFVKLVNTIKNYNVELSPINQN